MPTCTLNGLTNDCGRYSAGVKYFWIGIYTSAATFDVTSGMVTGISGITYYKYEPAPNSADWDDNGVGTTNSLGFTCTHTANAFFAGNSAAKRNEMMLLSQSKQSIIVEELDGTLFLLGKDAGMWSTVEKYNSKKQGSDGGKGFDFTSVGENSELADEVTDTTVFIHN